MSFYALPKTKFADLPIKPKGDHITFINVEDWTEEEWLDYRDFGIDQDGNVKGGFGGSEIAGVCAAYSDYLRSFIHTDPIKIHCVKIGEPVLQFQGNRFSWFGKLHERTLAYLYQFWDPSIPTIERLFENEENQNIINQVYYPKMYVRNSKYPHLFYSPDGITMNHRGVINNEYKNTSTMEARNYEDYVNPSFRMQVQDGLMITEHDAASIFIHLDGNNVMEVYEPPNKEFHEWILEKSILFLKNVQECIQIKEEYDIEAYYFQSMEAFTDRQLEGIAELQKREPTLTGNLTEESFIKELIDARTESIIREMTPEEHELAMERKEYLNRSKQIDKDIRIVTTKIARLIQESGCNKIVGDLESQRPWISNKADKGKDTPTFRVSQEYQADKLQDNN